VVNSENRRFIHY